LNTPEKINIVKINEMRKLTVLALVLCLNNQLYSQIATNSKNYFVAKEFNKEIALFNAKSFLFKNVLNTKESVDKFEVIPLASTNSGELTTLLYKSDTKQKEGIILGFYGNYWNAAGVLYQGYAFKNLDKENALKFLNKIEESIEKNYKFLKENNDNNNITFMYDDMHVLIWTVSGSYSIRIFWDGFDSTWEKTAYEKSKRRFEKALK